VLHEEEVDKIRARLEYSPQQSDQKVSGFSLLGAISSLVEYLWSCSCRLQLHNSL